MKVAPAPGPSLAAVDAAAVQLDQPLRHRQGQARGRRASGPTTDRRGRGARTSAASRAGSMPAPSSRTASSRLAAERPHQHLDPTAVRGELDGVAQQDRDHLAQPVGVAGERVRRAARGSGYRRSRLGVGGRALPPRRPRSPAQPSRAAAAAMPRCGPKAPGRRRSARRAAAPAAPRCARSRRGRARAVAGSARLSCSALAQPSTAPIGVRRACERLEMNSSLRRKVRATSVRRRLRVRRRPRRSRGSARAGRPRSPASETGCEKRSKRRPSASSSSVAGLLRRRLQRLRTGRRRRRARGSGSPGDGPGPRLLRRQLRRGRARTARGSAGCRPRAGRLHR